MVNPTIFDNRKVDAFCGLGAGIGNLLGRLGSVALSVLISMPRDDSRHFAWIFQAALLTRPEGPKEAEPSGVSPGWNPISMNCGTAALGCGS